GVRTPQLGYNADSVRQKFTQKERDNETGLDYFLARYFASSQGRFTSPDNIAYSKTVDPQTWNEYAYCRNGPLARTDPDGHNWFLIHGDDGDAWEWHSKKEVKKTKNGEVYADAATGRTYTSKFTNLVIINVSSTQNRDGGNLASVTVYG